MAINKITNMIDTILTKRRLNYPREVLCKRHYVPEKCLSDGTQRVWHNRC